MNKIVHKDLSYQIINAAFGVHNTLGCGFLEKVYENALVINLRKKRINCKQQEAIKVIYENEVVGDYIADILVEDKIILEIKAVDQISDVHRAQVMNYLKATKIKLGIIINFAEPKLIYKRIVL